MFAAFCALLVAVAFISRYDKGLFDETAEITHAPIKEDRKLFAKQTNEQMKISATYANNLAVGLIIAGLVAPTVKGDYPPTLWFQVLILISVCLHIGARVLLGRLKSEE